MTDIQHALHYKLETIKAFVEGIDYDYDALDAFVEARESLEQAVKDLQTSYAEKMAILKTLALAEECHAGFEVDFTKYQDAVDAGYDDKVTLEMRDKHKRVLEESETELRGLYKELSQVSTTISDQLVTVKTCQDTLAEMEVKPHPLGLESPDENYEDACASVLSVQRRTVWTDDEHNGKDEELCLQLAIGGPDIRLYAQVVKGNIGHCVLVCRWGGERAELTDPDLARFIEYVNPI